MERLRLPEWVANIGPVLMAGMIGVLFAGWVLFGGYSGPEGSSINARFNLRNRFEPWTEPSDNILFIDINDSALESNTEPNTHTPRRWPWPRGQWALLHAALHAHGIRPAAIVYDIVFDLPDNASFEDSFMGFRLVESASPEEQAATPTNDQIFQEWMEKTSDIPTFLAALFLPQSPVKFTVEEYARAKVSASDREKRTWQPPPASFSRFGIPYQPEVHDPVYHALEVGIPWDSEWWMSTVDPEEGAGYEDLEFMGLAASLLQPAAGAGATTMDPEADGITRYAPLFFEYNDVLYPSLPFQVVLHLLKADPAKIYFIEDYAVVPLPDGEEIYIPSDERKRMVVNFRFPWGAEAKAGSAIGKPFQHVNYWKLIDGFDQLNLLKQGQVSEFDTSFIDPRALDGKIVIIGSSAEGTHDLRAVPIASRYPMVGHIGEVIRSILQRDFLMMAPRWLNAIWIIGGTMLVGILGQFFAPVNHAFATVFLAVAHGFSSYFLFSKAGIVVDFFHVSLAEIVAYAVVTVSQYMRVSNIFGRYVTPEVRRYLLSNRSALELGGQETEVSILFSDLSGFTSMSEKMQAREVIATLNEYFGPMFRIIIDEEKGTLDKLIGDAIMAYFGHPQPMPEHPVQAVTAALKMQRKLAELRETWEKQGRPPIRMRIGVNTGVVVAGNMGDSGRTDYSIIGDSVNLASRLESNAPVDGVLISETTYEHVKDRFKFKEREPIKVKGKEKPVKVYEVLDFA
ncbi:MAG: adenylate/guanylate cyclase domain-containing protein [Candidatus Omnitrophica bacterium]|nr:hypothetical protein [bacterium]NUN95797.1 adenylate/guanylate cyclase domain-containing protein [Candidatus Omnitrophota bacterium]